MVLRWTLIMLFLATVATFPIFSFLEQYSLLCLQVSFSSDMIQKWIEPSVPPEPIERLLQSFSHMHPPYSPIDFEATLELVAVLAVEI